MKLLPIVLLYFVSNLLPAQDPGTHFRHLNTRNGLSSDNVTCFFKDSKGFLWIGSNGDGLNRFDGQNVKIFRHLANNHNSLLNNDIRAICEDPKGRIWVATSSGLSILNYDLQFSNYRQIPCDTGIMDLSGGINALALFKGFMFLGTNTGIAKVASDLKMAISSKTLLAKGTIPTKIRCIPAGMHITRAGLWISTHKGLLYTKDGKEFYHQGHNPAHNRILDLGFIPGFCESANGDIVCMDWGFPGVYRYNTQSGRTDSIRIAEDVEFSPISMLQVKDGLFWTSTMFKGVAEVDIHKGTYRFIKSDPGMPGSLSNDGVNFLFKDEQGSIFVSTGDGVDYVHPSQCNFNQIKTVVSDGSAFPTLSSYSLYQDKRNQIWAGSFSLGLYKIDLASGKILHIGLKENEKSIWAISELENKLLLGTYDGLGTYNENADAFVKLNLPDGVAELTENGFTFITRDHKQNWWIGLWRNGLLMLNSDFSKHTYYAPSDTGSLVKYPTPSGGIIDGQNRLWFGYMESTGITGIDLDELKATHYTTATKDSDLDNGGASSMELLNGALWITTTNAGLLKFDPGTRKTSVFNTSNGMPSDNMNFLHPDRNGMLWIGSTAGLIKFNPKTLKSQTYHYSDGLPSENLAEADLIFLQNGNALMTCGRYLMGFNPLEMTTNPYFPKITLTAIKKSGIEIPITPGLLEIDVYSRDKMISFEFTGINFIDADKNSYSYKLEGYDNRWISLGNINTISFTSLPAGNYTLYLNCSNKDGVLNPELLKFTLHVHGPFWKTWWFMILIIFTVLGMLYLFYRYRLFRIYQLQAIRDNISRDLHDDIGSALSSIAIYSEVAKKMSESKFPEIIPTLQNLQTTAKHAMENMSDIVWAINPKNDKFQDVVHRIEIFAQQMFSAKGVTFNSDISDDITFKTLSIQQRKNIYLMCKEAINNVAKYADAAECSLNIYKNSQHVVIEIKDNGNGLKADPKE